MKDVEDAIIVHSMIAMGAITIALVAAKMFP
jgi:S-formylglutathione hydrolase FrmB